MTREESIKRLRGILTEAVEFENSVCYVTEEDREPLEMAIKALEQEPCEDTISRQATIDKIRKHWISGTVAYRIADDIINDINTLPSIAPKQKTSVIDEIRTEISDFEEEAFHRPNTDYSDYAAIRHCLEIIDKYKEENEPMGWLIGDAEGGVIYKCFCPKCGKGLLDFVSGSEMWWIADKDLPKFCPHCGSKNRA